MKVFSSATVFVVLSLLTVAGWSQSVSLPLKSVKKPASDLLQNGQNIDVGQAARLADQGFDLSTLDPQNNRFWQNQKYSTIDDNKNFPAAGLGVQFVSDEVQIYGTYMGKVVSKSNAQSYYRLSLSRFSQSTKMRAALLRKLGYFVPSPKGYKDLRIFFKDEAQKKNFLETAQYVPVLNDFKSRNWVLEDNTQNHSVVLADAILEPISPEYFDIPWGFAPNPEIPEQLPTIQNLSKYRAFRALILPYSLVDIPESVNRYSAQGASLLSGHVVMNHPSAEAFSAATYEDVKWLLRRMQSWTEKDFDEVVVAAEYPAEIQSLVKAKFLHRTKNLFDLFNLKFAVVTPDLKINSPSGLVTNGKVTKEFVPGYPQRFSHGDRESPFKDGDFQRYLSIRGISSGLTTALGEMNKKLQALTIQDIARNRGQDLQQRFLKHIKERPSEPFYQKVEAFGGPLLGANVYSTRHVSTGTYNESSAAIQLVDNVSIGANLGYFLTIDGLSNKVFPGAGANVMVLRDYTHVRPLMSIQEGTQVKWGDIVVPRFMNKLAVVLKATEPIEGKKPDQPSKLPLDAFLSELREGEVFTITDSVALSTYMQISSSFDVLLGITPLGIANSIALGADASRVIMRQTTIMKTSQGLQVYVRDQSSKIFGVTFDVNYFINILKYRATTNSTDLHTDAFIIDYNPEYADLIDTQSDQPFVQDFIKTREDLKPALYGLFGQNETEFLYNRFDHKRFDLEHQLKTKEKKFKFLWWRSNSFNEDHLLKIQYPRDLDHPEMDPADEEVVLFSAKKGKLKGKDLLDVGIDLLESGIDQISGYKPNINSDLNPNPANAPLGQASWRIVNTEADLTTDEHLHGHERYPDISIVQNVWGGWKIKQQDFFKLVDKISNQFKSSGLVNYPLIQKEAFANVKSIDFYRITGNLSILPEGVNRLRGLMSLPTKSLFTELITMLGSGDHASGVKIYKEQCQRYRAFKSSGPRPMPVYIGGTVNRQSFDCLVPWMERLLKLGSSYPTDRRNQVRWMTVVLWLLDDDLPRPGLMKFLGEGNFLFVVRVNGFRTGDEDGDLEYFSNTIGDPDKNLEYANGLFNMFSTKTRISPIEIDRTQGGFR